MDTIDTLKETSKIQTILSKHRLPLYDIGLLGLVIGSISLEP